MTEIKQKVEIAEQDASSAEEEAVTYISEGIEATYVVQKKHEHDRKKQDLLKKEKEVGEKKH